MVYITVKRKWTRGPYIAKFLEKELGEATLRIGHGLTRGDGWVLRWIYGTDVQPEEHGHWQVELEDEEFATIFKLKWS